MNTFRTRVAAVFVVMGLVLAGLGAATATASAESGRSTANPEKASSAVTAKRVPKRFKNCTNLRKTWAHGVGRKNARDKTSGVPVTNFKRSNKLFKKAMKHNRGLDRDKDKIACEQH